MALYKSSQLMYADDFMKDLGEEDEVVLYEEKPSEEDVVELHSSEESPSVEVSFKLAPLPGSDADMPLEVSTDDDIEVEEDEKKDKNDLQEKEDIEVQDPWNPQKTHGADRIFEWYRDRINNVPKHTGREISGIERVIAYLERMDREMSKVIANDYDGKIDIQAFENARRELHSAVDRCEKALDTLKKSVSRATSQNDLVKEGQKATHVGGIIVTVPIFISRLARICINGSVSAGHDIEDLYARLVKKHALDDKQQAELMQLLFDMGYPLRRDRGYNVDELIDQTSSDNMDWAANYQA